MEKLDRLEKIIEDCVFPAKISTDEGSIEGFGIKRRDYIASRVMQGLLASHATPQWPVADVYAAKSVELADALINALSKEVSNG